MMGFGFSYLGVICLIWSICRLLQFVIVHLRVYCWLGLLNCFAAHLVVIHCIARFSSICYLLRFLLMFVAETLITFVAGLLYSVLLLGLRLFDYFGCCLCVEYLLFVFYYILNWCLEFAYLVVGLILVGFVAIYYLFDAYYCELFVWLFWFVRFVVLWICLLCCYVGWLTSWCLQTWVAP